jgi:hypothetical protein
MAAFKKGDTIRIRLDTQSAYRGRIGTVDREPVTEAGIVWYKIKFTYSGSPITSRFQEKDLESKPK